MKPQKIKITSNSVEKAKFDKNRNFCPFDLMNNYMHLLGTFLTDDEQFFCVQRQNTSNL